MEYQFGEFLFRAEIRRASDLKPVLACPDKLKGDFDAYYMFRDIYESEEDKRKILDARLRYDFTIIPPAEIGGESVKTYGHYHPTNSAGLTYPEIYQVLEGKAIFVIQRREGEKLVDCIAIEAEKGDLIIVPPGCGHVTINPTKKVLLTSNWVCRDFNSIYDPYTRLRGACYYYIDHEWVKNGNYTAVPEIRFLEPFDNQEEEMYYFVDEIEKLEFLIAPEKHYNLFKKYLKN
ncbi:MAG: glucose-6-phosphate isomerase [Archaeoglobi archaeon]|jgi:glucose-6-phosphate isomerase|nr:MAG: glucose-6-phosphate isomerase [Archaeoglobi archaeon]